MARASEQSRTSLYLVLRAEALLGALRFFNDSERNDRAFHFLAQIDYWEWEVDNLIYSFTNLVDRSRTWESPTAAMRKLESLGIAVSTKVIHRVRWQSRWKRQQEHRRVAPVSLLRVTIDLWNALIDTAEVRFIEPMRENAERFNMQVARDLRRLRKTMPELESQTF
jgi:hypothetical protein